MSLFNPKNLPDIPLRRFGARVLLTCVLIVSAMLTMTAPGRAQEPTGVTEQAAPDLNSLQAGWWSYFDGEREQIEPRAQSFIQMLREQADAVDTPTQILALPMLDALQEDFSAYLNLLDNTDVAMPSVPAADVSYSLNDLLDLAAIERNAALSATAEQLEVEREERVRDATASRRDLAFRVYVDSPEGDERWLSGLRLVQARLTQALSERRLALLSERSASAAEYAEAAAERVDLARSLLSPTAMENEVADLLTEISDAESALEEARRALRTAQVAASVLSLDTAQGRSQQRLQAQQLIGAEINLASAELAVANAGARYWWTVLKREAVVDLPEFEIQSLAWSELFRSVERRIADWQSDTEDELLAVQSLNRAGMGNESIRLLDERLAAAQQTLSSKAELDADLADLGLMISVVDVALTEYSGAFRSWLASISRAARAAYNRTIALADVTLFSVGETPVTGGDILRVIIILSVAVLLSRGIRAAIRRVSQDDFSGTQASMYTVGRLTHYAIIIIALFIALTSIGLDFSNLALVAGALSVGIGFGLQSIVNNFVSGLIILFERSLRVGDYIELDTGLTGTVKAINVRSTLINTNDNIDIVVPNSEFVTTRLTNWTLGERILRVRIPFGVAYGSDKELVRKAAMEAAAEVPYTLTNMKNRDPDVWLVEFGDNSLNFLLLVWVNRQGARRPTRTRAAYLWALESTLTKYGIEIPFPQRDLHLRSGWPGPTDQARAATTE